MKGKPLEIWWQDEARVGQQGTLSYVWADHGSRPPAPRDCRYTWVYIFGAVCPAREAAAALVLPTVNIEAMPLHLAEISSQVAPSAHAILILDGAARHKTGGAPVVPDNITLVPLPPYAPELNPVENIWQYLRQNALSHLVWESYEIIVDACCKAWNDLAATPHRIRSIASRQWASVIG